MIRKYLCVLLLPVLSACVQDVDLVTGDRKVAIECILTDENVQTLRLSVTSGVSGIEQNALGEAVATLTDLTASSTVGTFERKEPGAWTLDYAALPGHSYRLEVEVPGYGTVSAEDTMPDELDVQYLMFFWPLEPPADSSYFFYRRLDGHYGGLIEDMFFETASLPDHLLIKGYEYDSATGSHKMIGMVCSDSPGVDNRNSSGQVFVPGTVVNRRGSTGKIDINLEGCLCHNDFLRIEKDKALSQRFFNVSGNFKKLVDLDKGQVWWGWMPGTPSLIANPSPVHMFIPMQADANYFLFMAISDNYNSFLDDAMSVESDELSNVFVRDSAFSNVDGGVGILGCATTQKLPVVKWPCPVD